MARNSLLSIHYDVEMVYDEEGSIIFRSNQPIFTHLTAEINCLELLKNLVLLSVGIQQTKKVKKIYYRYPTEVDGTLIYKRYRLHDDEDIRLIRSWHNRWANVHLLELAVFLVDLGGRGSSADTINESLLSGLVRQNIRRTMVDLNMAPEGSQEGSNIEVDNAELGGGVESHDGSTVRDPMMDQYEANPDDGDNAEEEPAKIPDDGDDEEEMNFYGNTQITLTQPAISQPYDCRDHFSRLNLEVMTSDWSFTQGGPEDDPRNGFEVGQHFHNKEEVMLAVKTYSISEAVEYKIVNSDQWRYNAQGDSQHIFTIVKADPTISIWVLQGSVEKHSVTRRPTGRFGSQSRE
ncbi:hypothetical protein Ahy_Scaffold6g108271 isoform A [Arachis hypogaea]|uniref:Uncharacterized protein n=1 Tax=Arachis hypogaea TaxID=3818 RepID=A0A444WQ16_ARAHY|nr:hypothetical protein Ahy_Scaffold6g108271 isoform A [Arachis hypogaea]